MLLFSVSKTAVAGDVPEPHSGLKESPGGCPQHEQSSAEVRPTWTDIEASIACCNFCVGWFQETRSSHSVSETTPSTDCTTTPVGDAVRQTESSSEVAEKLDAVDLDSVVVSEESDSLDTNSGRVDRVSSTDGDAKTPTVAEEGKEGSRNSVEGFLSKFSEPQAVVLGQAGGAADDTTGDSAADASNLEAEEMKFVVTNKDTGETFHIDEVDDQIDTDSYSLFPSKAVLDAAQAERERNQQVLSKAYLHCAITKFTSLVLCKAHGMFV